MVEEKKELSKEAFFEGEEKKIKQKQWSAIIKGFMIIGIVMFLFFCLAFFFAFLISALITASVATGMVFGVTSGIIAALIVLPVIFFLMMYFVWGPEDVCWSSFPREGYAKIILQGNKFSRVIGVPKGKKYDDDWNVVDDPDKKSGPGGILGLHIISLWPFETVYKEKAEWQKYDTNTGEVKKRRELLREFSMMLYPFYFEVKEAEDRERMGVDLRIVVAMRVVNPKKAFFETTTSWIDVVGPIIQSGCVSFIKQYTFQEMLSLQDIDSRLMKVTISSSSSDFAMVDMIKEKYGIEIENISILDIAGSDEEQKKAIQKMAIAQREKDAALVTADKQAQELARKTMGAAIEMLAQTIILPKPMPQGAEDIKTPQEYIKFLMANNSPKFKKDYGEMFNRCLNLVKKQMALDKNSYFEFSTNAKGFDLSGLIALSSFMKDDKVMSGHGQRQENDNKKDKGRSLSREERKPL